MWYVVEDDEGFWMTDESAEGDRIVFQSNIQEEVEWRLAREISGGD